jgi:hypothetical protein
VTFDKRQLSTRRILIGTWEAANWAIRFYTRHGFELVAPLHKTALLKTYWDVPDRQMEVSVVIGLTLRDRWRKTVDACDIAERTTGGTVMTQDVGNDAVNGIFNHLKIDADWSVPIPRGFAWWGHRLRQRIWSTPAYDDRGIIIHRVYAITDAIRDVQVSQTEVDVALSPLGTLAIGTAKIFDPKEKAVRLWTTATVHKGVAEWMTSLLASYAILQVIEAETTAGRASDMIKGVVDQTPHPTSGARQSPDEMLSVLDAAFRPIGQKNSPWNGCDEFQQIAGRLNTSNCFCTADSTGLTAEFQFGQETSMMRLISTENHPVIGSGVGMFLQIPISDSEESASKIAGALNRAEANGQAPSHLIGSWCSKTFGDRSVPAFATFIPTALFRPGLLSSLVYSATARARWVGRFLEPNTEAENVVGLMFRRLGIVGA